MKSLHYADIYCSQLLTPVFRAGEKEVQMQKARMEKEEEIIRNVRIEEEETERIREETR